MTYFVGFEDSDGLGDILVVEGDGFTTPRGGLLGGFDDDFLSLKMIDVLSCNGV